MRNIKNFFPILILLVLVFSSSYAFVKTSDNSQMPVEEKVVPAKEKNDNSIPDTTRKFPVKEYKISSYEDLNKIYPMDTQKPDNVKSVIDYDPESGFYVFRTYVGNMEISTPYMMTGKEYFDYSGKKELQDYWKEKNSTVEKSNEDKFSVSDMKFNIGPADKVFGPGGVQVKTQGSAELVFGIKHNRIDNPALTEEMRSSIVPEFDMKIQMNVNGSVGDKVNFGMNYNTESTFDFDQKKVKLAYKGKEDDIIKNIEAGNVSMQLNSSLITGSTALFGIKTDLQFGKLNVSAIASQQQSETKTVSSKGGSQTTSFEVSADEYDENRHFFLSQYFRDHFESAMKSLPTVSSGITINRIEVWVTNKKADYDEARNIVAFEDLGEADRIDNPDLWSKEVSTSLPQNKANNLYESVKALAGVRDIDLTNSVLTSAFGETNFVGGEDFEKVESARKLEPSEYTLNTSLGILSLKSTLNSDEVLAVAYEYTYAGTTYQVGEFSSDNITTPKALFVKLLKSTTESPDLAMWDLMMKNVYYLGSTQIQEDGFELNIVYENDSVGTELQYLPVGNIKNKLLLKVMNLDRLDSKDNLNPDGKFDYVEGLTVLPTSGRIIFPVLEPFGKHLREEIGDSIIADKYAFDELYNSTLVDAQELTEKNKFKLVGEYKSSSSSQINLNAMNVPRGSVTVTAGGATLTENVDYTVDYTMGTVTILNESILESGTSVDVKLENQSTFSMQRKSLVGTHLEYQFNKDFTLGGTIMHLSEVPLTTKVNTGDEPISNTIWGLNTSWKTESQWLTNMVDKLPFVNATKPSTIALNAEFAQLIPGHSSVVSSAGLAYIDDFESTQTSIDLHYPVNWYLASTPYNPKEDEALFPEAASSGLDYGKNRALLAWYYVDQILNSTNPGRTTPVNLRNNVESQSNHYTRDVLVKEVFPNKSTLVTDRAILTVMNLSFYPTERGPYNLVVDKNMDANGYLTNPAQRWGGIMRKLDNTDFETANIEYIEFWLMDPFIYDEDGIDKGGDLYFNLGDISEDILKDGKKAFEHGLPIDGDTTKTTSTIWGRVPKTQSTVTAFDNTEGARAHQDVGLDGLSTEDEFKFPSYRDYVSEVEAKITPEARERMKSDRFSPINDPAGDNYSFYKSTIYDNEDADILTRYKHYNGTEGNSPDANNTDETYSTTATSLPDVEDVNGDNTLNEYEKYYQYKVAIKKDSMVVGYNHIVDSYTSTVNLANGTSEPVTWYQFKIPIREYQEKIGNIRNFKSIRFMRMFMTGFEQEKHLRFASLDLVRGEWRTFSKVLYNAGTVPVSDGTLDVQSVNIEENSDKTPVNYVMPPGITRETDPGQTQILQLNEQSMVLKVSDLAPGDARGVYKQTSYDMRNYKRFQMFVHAEQPADDTHNLEDYQLSCFVRLGSDLTNNYYEYEIPLKLTPARVYSGDSDDDRETVWPEENMFDFPFSVLTNAKLKRNKAKQDGSYISDLIPYYDNDKNKIRVVGNPTLSDVQNIMIGIRDISGEIKSGEVWVNEMRLSEFDESGGWAAMGNLAVSVSDIGNINVSGRVETAGYGSIESNVLNRRQDDLYQMNLSTNMELGRFLPEKVKIQLPAYFSYTNQTVTPKYDPLDEDILLTDALDNLDSQSAKDTLIANSKTITTSKSFNISSAKVNIKSKKPQFYDPANVTFTYAYSENNEASPEVEKNMDKQERGAINYNYSFGNKPVEPFKNVKALDKPIYKIIKDFNFNYQPSSISFNTDMNRQFSQVLLRDFTGELSRENLLTFSKDFAWNRNFDIKFDLTKSLHLSFQTAMNANIEEYQYTPEIGKEYYEQWRDTVLASIRKLGTPYTYQQVFSASWTLPINKIPLFDWITANTSYNSTYNWNRTAMYEDSVSIGNVATSMGAFSIDGQFNFEKLYTKSAYLKNVNRKFSMQQNRQKFVPKSYKQTINLEQGNKLTLNHKLRSQTLKLFATDKKGKQINLNYKQANENSLDIFPKENMDSVTVIVTTLDPNNVSFARKAVDFGSRFLMMVRRASFTYRKSSSMVLPGLLSEPGFLGQDKEGKSIPGYAFTFGLFDDNTLQNAVDNGWLYGGTDVVNPVTLAYTSDLDIKANLEPIPGFKISLNAKRYTADNSTVQYMYNGMPTTYNGSYNITQVAIATAFKKLGTAERGYESEVYNKFLENRQIIANRLNAKYAGTKYPTTGFFEDLSDVPETYNSELGAYGLNSADVLIPAFLSAYTGRDVNIMDTNPFLSMLNTLPNWSISYDGLSKIPWIKDRFKSVSISHAYTCRYSIGSYTSYSDWVALGSADDLMGFVFDESTKSIIPSSPYSISTVSLSEQFSPLFGVNVAMKNSMTAKAEYKKQRSLSLNLSSTQLVEANSDEFVLGLGYVLKDFDVILRLKNDQQSKIKNDLKISADLSYKDIKTLLRKIEEDVTQASSGNKLFTLKIMADYVFSSKVNIQLFYDRQATTPLISSTYPVSSTNFGLSFKFMLTR
ncbi:MAG: cell surface protein SprA [Paludibacter sp.]|nr:cell surface protein SprA [Paludibacter sp.]